MKNRILLLQPYLNAYNILNDVTLYEPYQKSKTRSTITKKERKRRTKLKKSC